MNKGTLVGLIFITALVSGSIMLVSVDIYNDYNILSNEELYNISNNAYIQGALSISKTGNVPYIQNGTTQITTLQNICNLNNNGGTNNGN